MNKPLNMLSTNAVKKTECCSINLIEFVDDYQDEQKVSKSHSSLDIDNKKKLPHLVILKKCAQQDPIYNSSHKATRVSTHTNQLALNKLMPVIIDDLRRLAKSYMKKEIYNHTLQATALVNEAYLKLIDINLLSKDKTYLIAAASKIMRHILVDYAKSKKRLKRGGGVEFEELNDADSVCDCNPQDMVMIDKVLKQLKSFDNRAERIFELHAFGGFKREEISELEGLSIPTIDRELKVAKAWIISRLNESM